MKPERILEYTMRLEKLLTDRLGMIALNLERESQGYSYAYGEGAFYDLADKIHALREEFLSEK